LAIAVAFLRFYDPSEPHCRELGAVLAALEEYEQTLEEIL
jgi:hypothetical protein